MWLLVLLFLTSFFITFLFTLLVIRCVYFFIVKSRKKQDSSDKTAKDVFEAKVRELISPLESDDEES